MHISLLLVLNRLAEDLLRAALFFKVFGAPQAAGLGVPVGTEESWETIPAGETIPDKEEEEGLNLSPETLTHPGPG